MVVSFHFNYLGVKVVFIQFRLSGFYHRQFEVWIFCADPDCDWNFAFRQIKIRIEIFSHGAGVDTGSGKVARLHHCHVQGKNRARRVAKNVEPGAINRMLCTDSLNYVMQKLRTIGVHAPFA